MEIQSSDTLVAFSLIYGNLQRRHGGFLGPDFMSVSDLNAVTYFSGRLRPRLIPSLALLLSPLKSPDSETLQFGSSMLIYKQLTFLARAGFAQTQFSEYVT